MQGRGEEAAAQLMRDAKAVQDAGAFAVVLELVPAEPAEVTRALHIPTVGIGPDPTPTHRSWCGPTCWTDRRAGAEVRQAVRGLRRVMGDAAKAFAQDVIGGTFPLDEHSVH